MTITRLAAILFIIITGYGASTQDTCGIIKSELERHVYFLASDSLEGRETGKPGQKIAAEYISGEFMDAGLIPFSEGGYTQEFKLYRNEADKILFHGERKKFTAISHISPGYRIPDSCSLYFGDKKSFQNTQLQSERDFHLVLSPKSLKQARRVIERSYPSGIRNFILLIDDDKFHRKVQRDFSKHYNWRIERRAPETILDKITEGYDSIAVSLFGLGHMRSLTGETPNIDNWTREARKGKRLIPIEGYYATEFRIGSIDSIITENVIGKLEGTSRNDEYVVITAHYDHIGKDKHGINAGADDNASGTAALMEIARDLSCRQTNGEVFNRSVLFVAFSAEELGLLGSAYFVGSAEFDQSKAILNINMDMIGRSIKYSIFEVLMNEGSGINMDSTRIESYVYVMNRGKGTRDHVKKVKGVAKNHKGFMIDRNPGLLKRLSYRFSSDHANFSRVGIPILVFFTGLHPDYHTPRDTADKIDYGNLRIITDVITETVIRIIKE